MASFSEDSKARIRRALGYMGMSEAAAISYGFVVNAEYLYLINERMDGDDHEQSFVNLVLEELQRVDETDRMMFTAQKRLAASAVGNIRTNPQEIERLEQARVRWAGRLADLLGVPFYRNPFRHSGGLNRRVSHG